MKNGLGSSRSDCRQEPFRNYGKAHEREVGIPSLWREHEIGVLRPPLTMLGVSRAFLSTLPRLSEESAISLSLKTHHRRPRLASNLSGRTQSDPTISPVTTAIMITTSNSLLGESGRSNQMGGDLLHTMAVV